MKLILKKPMLTTIAIILIIVVGVLVYTKYGLHLNKEKPPAEITVMNYTDAKDYVESYANYQKIPFNEVMTIDDGKRFRGDVYNMEFEYKPMEHMLVARGYVDHNSYNTTPLAQDIWNALLKIQNNPNSVETNQIVSGKKLDFTNKEFELDTTIKEVKSDYVYRVNLRTDFTDTSVRKDEFVKQIKALADESYKWDKSYFGQVVDFVNKKEVFPQRSASLVTSYAKAMGLPDPMINSVDQSFSRTINSISFDFDIKTGDLFITKVIPIVKDINTDLNFYNNKIKNDPAWWWMAEVKNTGGILTLDIQTSPTKSEKDSIEMINHSVDSIYNWSKEIK